MKLDSIDYFFVDIDGTITDYKPGAMKPEEQLAGNFLFPIIRDMLVEDGWDHAEAGTAITDESQHNVYWDYSDLIAKFEVCEIEAFARMRQWHYDNLTCYKDMVETVKELNARGKILFIISNNPYWGCLFKLESAGLANQRDAPFFKRIFGTNIVNGCKNSPEVWQRALTQLSIEPGKIATIGDNPEEDGEIPQSCGIGHSFILNRASKEPLRHEDKYIFLNDARQILTESI
jgi:FMN phosphatase YigB (HAD superfamily)